MLLFGHALLAFGPSLVLFVITVAKFPVRVILMVTGAFAWLISLLLSALLWLAIVPLRDQLAFSLVFSVIFQELSRVAMFKLMTKAENGLSAALSSVETKSITGHKLSYVMGFGFGLMSGLFSFVNILAQQSGPGVVGIQGHSNNYFRVSAGLSCAFIFSNISWTIISFATLKKRRYFMYVFVPVCHMLMSCFTLISSDSSAVVKVVTSVFITIISGLAAFKTAGGSMKSVINCLKACVSGGDNGVQ